MSAAASFIVDRPIFIKRRPLAVAQTARRRRRQRDPFTGIGRIRIRLVLLLTISIVTYCICDLNSIKGFSGCCNESQLVRSGFYDEEGGRAVSTRDGKESAPNRSK